MGPNLFTILPFRALNAGFSFCPRNWLPANGGLLSISQNQALFALFGTYYGGNGVSTFALPTIRPSCGGGAGCEQISYCIAGSGVFPSRN